MYIKVRNTHASRQTDEDHDAYEHCPYGCLVKARDQPTLAAEGEAHEVPQGPHRLQD